VNDTLSGAGLYDSIAAAAVASAFDGGYSYNFRAGLRPAADGGVYLDAGYSHTGLDGVVDLGNMLSSQASGGALPPQARRLAGNIDASYDLKTSLDMLMLELGWEGHWGARALLGLGVGLMAPLGAKTELSGGRGSAALASEMRAIAQEAAETLDSNLTKYGYLPSVTLRLGADLL
jgi:hypothetical protein